MLFQFPHLLISIGVLLSKIEAQKPAPLKNVTIKEDSRSASFMINIEKSSSPITELIIYLENRVYLNLPRKDSYDIKIDGLRPNFNYSVKIEVRDASSQKFSADYNFTTKEAAPSGPPLNVTFTSRSKTALEFAWSDPAENERNGKIIGYKVCYLSSLHVSKRECENIKSKMYRITGLDHSTKYFVTVAARTKPGVGSRSEKIGKITNGDAVEPVVKSSTSLTLTIKRQESYIRKVIVIVKKSTGQNVPVEDIKTSDLKPYNQSNSQNPYIAACLEGISQRSIKLVIGGGNEYYCNRNRFTNQALKPNTNYIVFLRFFETEGKKFYSTEWSNIVTTFHKPQAPSGPPLQVRFKSRTKSSLRLSWEEPAEGKTGYEDTGEPGRITGYQVCYSTSRNQITAICTKAITPTSYTIYGLIPSTKYFFTVAARNGVGFGKKSKIVKSITNGDAVEPVVNSSTSLTLTIKKQEHYIRKVIVIVKRSTGQKVPVEDIKTSDLKPYNQLNSQNPYIAACLEANSHRSIKLVIGDGNEYYCNRKRFTNQALRPNTNYTVFLRFFQKKGKYYSTEWSNIVTTFHKPQAPIGPPLQVRLKSRTKSSLRLSWEEPAEGKTGYQESGETGRITGYRVCYLTSPDQKNANCTEVINATSHTIYGLKPSTKYFVTVSARNSIGFGKKSKIVKFITNGDAVEPVVRSSTSLTLTIKKQESYIRKLIVIVKKSTGQKVPVEDIKTSDLKPYNQLNSQNPYIAACLEANSQRSIKLVIGGGNEYYCNRKRLTNQALKPNTNYIIFLRFFESEGQKFYSTEWSNIVTTFDKPQVPSGAPLQVTFESRTKSSLRLSWEEPAEGQSGYQETGEPGRITVYQVCYSTSPDQKNANCTGAINPTSYTIYNLKPSTKYFVTVAARNSIGFGKKSRIVKSITNGDAVNPVVKSSTSLTITIKKQESYIKNLIVIVKKTTGQEVPVENIKTSDLKPYSQSNPQNLYIAVHVKANFKRLTLVIGDGEKYNFSGKIYTNQALKSNTSYVVFIRFFEKERKKYYSTEWSNIVTTFHKSQAGWKNIGTGCAGSRGNHFANLTYRGLPGFVRAFRMTHTRGRIGCYAGARTNWGCNGHHRTNMFVTDVQNVIMYPSPVLTKPFQAGGWYRLPGYGQNSPQLVFSDVGTRFIYSGQQMRVWYGEDLYGYTEDDNHGFTCFTAELYFVH